MKPMFDIFEIDFRGYFKELVHSEIMLVTVDGYRYKKYGTYISTQKVEQRIMRNAAVVLKMISNGERICKYCRIVFYMF